MENVCESLYEIVNLFDGWYRGLRRGVSALPKEGEYLYPFCVETKAALILGGGGITGGMYELGALSAMDDFIVSGRKSGQFDLYAGISAGSILAAFPTIAGQCGSLTERGVTAIAEQSFRVNSRVKLELGALLFRADHPETDLLMIEPSPAESSLFLYGSMNFTERVHSLNYGYNSSVYYFIENFDMLRERFARHGMEVSLEHLAADRFLQQAVMPPGRHRFGLKRQIFAAPAR